MNKVVTRICIVAIILSIAVIIGTIIYFKINENKDTKEAFENMGNAATDFITGIDTANSHLNDFEYNYETGEVEYNKKKLTLENYNKIKIGMSEAEVKEILGEGEKLSPIEANTYLINWIDENDTFCRIQIVFEKNTKTVLNIYQIGLE